jgi:hypothetical protein
MASIPTRHAAALAGRAEDLRAIGGGPDSMLIGHSVRFCDFCRHEPATSQLEDTAVGSECGYDTTDKRRRFPVCGRPRST